MSETPERVLPCPVCHEPMHTEEQRGVRVELCKEHGMWLDPDELETVVLRLSARYLRKGRRRATEARSSGKAAWAMFGWWALFLDP